MEKRIKLYYEKLGNLTNGIVITDNSKKVLDLESGFNAAIKLISRIRKTKNKLIFIGNGASAAISSHMAADFWKNASLKAIAFNDASLLTCLSNDFGYEYVFKKPIEMFADKGDILVAISSSGKSENILQAVKAARKKKLKIITLSGFSKFNPLRKAGGINFYVPAKDYGFVEVLHHSICHCLLDMIIKRKADE